MVSTLFRDPQARSSALAALGTPQPRAFGSLNRVETLDSTSNYYIVTPIHAVIPHNIIKGAYEQWTGLEYWLDLFPASKL